MRPEVKGWISSAAQRLKEAIVSLSVVTLLATVNDPCPQSCLWKFLSAPLYSHLGNESLQMDVNGSSLVGTTLCLCMPQAQMLPCTGPS